MISCHQTDETLKLTIQNECDFNVARELMRICKKQMDASKIVRIEIELEKVMTAHSCMIGVVLLLSERVQGNFDIRVKNCSPTVHHIFESGLLTPFFAGEFDVNEFNACVRCHPDHTSAPSLTSPL